MNISLLNVGLPTLARELDASNTGLEWIVDGYALVFAGFLLAAGSLGDRLGEAWSWHRDCSSSACAPAWRQGSSTVAELIAARCGMGLGAAFVMPMTLSILTDIYPHEAGLRRGDRDLGRHRVGGRRRGSAARRGAAGSVLVGLACFSSTFPLPWVRPWQWPSPSRTRAPRRDLRVDWVGAALSVLFSAGLVFALIEGPDLGWGDPVVVGSIVGAAVATVLFCVWELRCGEPLVDIRCFRIPAFSVGCGVVAMQYFLSFGIGFVVTQYLQLVLGLSALEAGFTLVPAAVVVMVVAPLGARAFGRFGARSVIVTAFVIATVGAAALSMSAVDSTVAPILVTLILTNLAIGLMAPGTTSMVMSAVPADQAGMASGTQSTTRQLGGALGVAAIGSLLAARYTANLSQAVAGTPAHRYLPVAKQSLAAALQAVPGGGPIQQFLSGVARQAFVDGLHVVGWTIAATAAASAVVVFLVLRAAPVTVVDDTAVAVEESPDIQAATLSPDEL